MNGIVIIFPSQWHFSQCREWASERGMVVAVQKFWGVDWKARPAYWRLWQC